MQSTVLLVVLVLCITTFAVAQESSVQEQEVSCPGGIRIRKEYRDLTRGEWVAYKRAVTRLLSSGRFDSFCNTHWVNVPHGHATPQFLPWHREFLFRFENALRQIDPSITIPYWQWSIDWRQPLRASIFDDRHWGFEPGTDGDCSWRIRTPTTHCLVRNYDPEDFGTFHSGAAIARLVNDRSTDYDTFRRRLEGPPHATLHATLGGDGGDLTSMNSCNDPLFYLHHVYIDKIWADRQRASGRPFDYGGRHMGRPARESDIIRPFNIPVSRTLDYANSYCYRYQPSSRQASVSRDSNGKYNITDVPFPRQVPNSWIKMMGTDFNETLFREDESYFNQAMQEASNNGDVVQTTDGTLVSPINENEKDVVEHPIQGTNTQSSDGVRLTAVLGIFLAVFLLRFIVHLR